MRDETAAPPPSHPCPACDCWTARTIAVGSDHLYHTTDEVFSVIECDGCGLMRLDPWPEPGRLGRYYPPNYWFSPGESQTGRLEDLYRRLVLGDHVRFVRRALEGARTRGPLLDIGCGGALFGRMLSEHGYRCFGLDYSREAAAVGWHVNGIPVVCGSLPSAPFPCESFTAITMFHVLEHVYDPAAYLKAARDLLVRNGRLIIQVPNASCWQFTLFGDAWNGLDIPRHLIDFRAKDIDALLSYSGFKPLNYKHFSLRDNPAGLATTLASSLDPMARRVRGQNEPDWLRLGKDLLYFGFVLAALPMTIVEAACGAGSTIMVEAVKI
jgi:SAM-dependent methyltransferase